MPTLSQLASAGFTDLSTAQRTFESLYPSFPNLEWMLNPGWQIPDPDRALHSVVMLQERISEAAHAGIHIATNENSFNKFALLLGSSAGFIDYLYRNPQELDFFVHETSGEKPKSENFLERLRESVRNVKTKNNTNTFREIEQKLRVRYRRILMEIALWDLSCERPVDILPEVLKLLSQLTDTVIQVALELAYLRLGIQEPQPFSIIAMGKLGAEELNYLSDVDLIFVAGNEQAVSETTSVAKTIITLLSSHGPEPALWPIDTNLRPEGRDGALVRTLESHLQYYERWAESWEFQALLKSRPIAGDPGLGFAYRTGVEEKIWASASRPNFVESVQKMRERVTENLVHEHAEREIKLGAGGIRDIEFTVQLLQLVHGQFDEHVRQRDTLGALRSLSQNSYIGRVEQQEMTERYCLLRVLEHRVQLDKLTRNHLMPNTEKDLRRLARSSKLAKNSQELTEIWLETKQNVRLLHEKLFYRPLLNTVAGLDAIDLKLTDEAAIARLSALGFRDSPSALKHISAMATGISRRAQIQRHLLPAILRWLSEGIDPDYGLLAFRRISDELGGTHWYLRMLRDSSGAAMRLTQLLSSSRFIGELLGHIPEATAWLESFDDLIPKNVAQLLIELQPISTMGKPEAQLGRIMMVRRREVLRIAMSWSLNRITVEEMGEALSHITIAYITALIDNIRHEYLDGIELCVFAMGRFGSAEQSLTSDADVIFVYQSHADDAATRVEKFIQILRHNAQDYILPFELDTDLRPEGKHGIQARSLTSFSAYYREHAETWEAQALLRAKAIYGPQGLVDDVYSVMNEVRYPKHFSLAQTIDVRRIKARVEAERLPKGADPHLHFKLGRGSLSDIEWLVQFVQLQHASTIHELQTVKTLDALRAAKNVIGLTKSELNLLIETWLFVSRIRSTKALVFGKNNDVLPTDFEELDHLAQAMGKPHRSGSELQEKYLQMTRKSRRIFEKYFYR